jgi:hypothetical protein
MGRLQSVGQVAVVGLILGLATIPVKVLAVCSGDCDGSGDVTINEIITMVNVALGTAQASACTNGIAVGTSVDVTSIIQAVNAALNSCTASAATPTPKPTAAATATATATFGVVATPTAAVVPPGISTQMLGIWSGRAVNQTTSVDKPARLKIEVINGSVVITDLGGNVFLNGTTLTATLIATPTSFVVNKTVGTYPNGYVDTLQLTIAPDGQLAGTYAKTTINFPPAVTVVALILNKES